MTEAWSLWKMLDVLVTGQDTLQKHKFKLRFCSKRWKHAFEWAVGCTVP